MFHSYIHTELCQQGASVWLRDLTRECVEANPGPNWQDIRTWIITNKVEERFRDQWDSKFTALTALLDVEYAAYLGSYGVPQVRAFLDKNAAQQQVTDIFTGPLLDSFRGYIDEYVKGIDSP